MGMCLCYYRSDRSSFNDSERDREGRKEKEGGGCHSLKSAL